MTLVQATKKLLISDPFYGLILMYLNKYFNSDIPTACVCLKGLNCDLIVNEEFWNKFDEYQQLQILKHELLHLCFFHLLSSSNFLDKKLFNIAADAEVNQYIDVEALETQGMKPINILKKYPGIQEKAGAKYYYDFLNKEQQKDPSLKGMTEPDNHSMWKEAEGLSDSEKKLIKDQFDGIVKNVATTLKKCRGTIPGEMSEYVEKLFEKFEPVFDWKRYFRRLLGTAEEYYLKTTRKKPSKRFPEAAGMKQKHLHNILVAVDTSGSVNNNELTEFFAEIKHIANTGGNIDVLECDTTVKRVYNFKKWNGKVSGRGGTDFSPIVEYFNKSKKDYSALVLFTDGEAPIDNLKPHKPMIWVITSDGREQNYPGKTIYIPKDRKQ